MSTPSSDTPQPNRPDRSHIASPCTGICRLDANGYCVGCQRSVSEIAAWGQMDANERQRIMSEVLPQRLVSHNNG